MKLTIPYFICTRFLGFRGHALGVWTGMDLFSHIAFGEAEVVAMSGVHSFIIAVWVCI